MNKYETLKLFKEEFEMLKNQMETVLELRNTCYEYEETEENKELMKSIEDLANEVDMIWYKCVR